MFLKEIKSQETYDDYLEFDDTDLEDLSNVNKDTYSAITDILMLLQEIVEEDNDSYSVKESFTTDVNAEAHYYKHCLANNTNRKSSRQNVLYDFTDLQGYLNLESKLNNLIVNVKESMYIQQPLDIQTDEQPKIVKGLRKLFEGNQILVFGTACGFVNDLGSVKVAIHSWANDNTTNYKNNTLDFVVLTPANETISLFSIDANRLLKQLNRILAKLNVTYTF